MWCCVGAVLPLLYCLTHTIMYSAFIVSFTFLDAPITTPDLNLDAHCAAQGITHIL
jgi:hypothetical protein